MKPPARGSLIPWLLQNDLTLLSSVYLAELELLAHGVPHGALLLAGRLSSKADQELLIQVTTAPRARRWQAALRHLVRTRERVDDRDSMLAEADEAKVARRHRRAAQLYGWLLMTSPEQDNAMEWSLRHLVDLRTTVYSRI